MFTINRNSLTAGPTFREKLLSTSSRFSSTSAAPSISCKQKVHEYLQGGKSIHQEVEACFSFQHMPNRRSMQQRHGFTTVTRLSPLYHRLLQSFLPAFTVEFWVNPFLPSLATTVLACWPEAATRQLQKTDCLNPKCCNLPCRAQNVFKFRKQMKNWMVI